MDVLPLGHRHQHTIVVFALVKGIHIVKVKIHNLDLRMVFPKIISQQIYLVAPFPTHHHEFFAIQILNGEPVFSRQPVMNGHRRADRFL